jgi:Arc/MetJ-type ribon-helix-helix transcriptional regulator
MTIHLPRDLENSVRSLVQGGRFAAVNDALAEAARLLLRQHLPAKKPLTEAELQQHMQDIGVMSQLPDTAADFDDPGDQPIDLEGEPLSETVIRERR